MAEPLTKERESEIRRMLTDIGPPKHEDAIGDLLAEIDLLRALPVLRTCAPCRHWRSYAGIDDAPDVVRCVRDELASAVDLDKPPPSRCPLRGAR